MDKNVEFVDQAIDEARVAHQWYAEQSANAAARFQQELEKAIASIADVPDRYPEYIHGTRYYQLRHFPYLVVYRQRETAIQIIAVAHAHRREGYWKGRSNGP